MPYGLSAQIRKHFAGLTDPRRREDRSRIRRGHADANFAIIRRMALSLLKNEKSQRVGVKTKRLTAGWNDDYLEQVLFGA